jgi:hypothetical protein
LVSHLLDVNAFDIIFLTQTALLAYRITPVYLQARDIVWPSKFDEPPSPLQARIGNPNAVRIANDPERQRELLIDRS